MFLGPVSPLASLFLQSSTEQQKKTSNELPWWGYLIILLFLLLILWIIYRPQKKAIHKAPASSINQKPPQPEEAIEKDAIKIIDENSIPDEPFDTEATEVEPAEFQKIKTASFFEPPHDILPQFPNNLPESEETIGISQSGAEFTEQTEHKPTTTEEDLTIIEGIGPKIQSVLKEAGIKNYLQLSELNVERIREILIAAGIRLGDPSSWPEQARLASLGKMDELKSFQVTLKGGRRA